MNKHLAISLLFLLSGCSTLVVQKNVSSEKIKMEKLECDETLDNLCVDLELDEFIGESEEAGNSEVEDRIDIFSIEIRDRYLTKQLHVISNYNMWIDGDKKTGIYQLDLERNSHVELCSYDNFTYEVESESYIITKKQVEEVQSILNNINFEKLSTTSGNQNPYRAIYGSTSYAGKTYKVAIQPENASIREFLVLLESFVKKSIPRNSRSIKIVTEDGDNAVAIPVSLAELAKHPNKYNGKRIQVRGLYSRRTSYHSFIKPISSKPKLKKRLWVGPFLPTSPKNNNNQPVVKLSSEFGACDNSQAQLHDKVIVIEGTFNSREWALNRCMLIEEKEK